MTVIDDYLKNVSSPQREVLERIRETVKQVVPDAEEAISYGMPTFTYHNHSLLWLGAFKNHMSIFPMPDPINVLGDKLGKFKTSRGTIQFTVDNPIPELILKEIIVNRLQTISKNTPKPKPV